MELLDKLNRGGTLLDPLIISQKNRSGMWWLTAVQPATAMRWWNLKEVRKVVSLIMTLGCKKADFVLFWKLEDMFSLPRGEQGSDNCWVPRWMADLQGKPSAVCRKCHPTLDGMESPSGDSWLNSNSERRMEKAVDEGKKKKKEGIYFLDREGWNCESQTQLELKLVRDVESNKTGYYRHHSNKWETKENRDPLWQRTWKKAEVFYAFLHWLSGLPYPYG